MKKIFAFAIALMLLLSLSSVAFARMQHSNLLLKKIVVIEDVPYVVSAVTVKNDRDTNFNNGKVIVSIPELDARASGRVSVHRGSGDTKRLSLDLPDDAPAGDYWVRVVVTNEDVTRIRHRLITIE